MSETSFFTKVNNFIKKFWGVFVAIFGITALLLMKKKGDDSADYIKQMQDSHAKEIEEVNKAREEERKKYAENEKKYQERMVVIENQYEAAKKEFDEKKKAQAAKLVKDYGDKPTELAEKLAEVTGFKVILPEE